ncbi:MAG: hypothetical protein ABFD54_10935 [Armatimonadota bacterium]|nr:hypothetical protein [bacterium]
MHITALSHAGSQYHVSTPADILYRKIGSSVVGEIFDLPARASDCDNGFRELLANALDEGHIHDAASSLRENALLVARASFPMRYHFDWLKERGFSREDIRQIRYVVEMFHNIEPVFAIIAALARRWSSGTARKTPQRHTSRRTQLITRAVFIHPPLLHDPYEHLPCLEPALRRHAEPIHQFYRALAIWPDYMQKMWDDLGGCVGMDSAISGLDARADALASRIPFTHSRDDADHSDMCWINRCCTVSLEVSLIASALRHGFTRDETAKRGNEHRRNLVQKNRLR